MPRNKTDILRVVHWIRTRCQELNLTWSDLYKATGTKGATCWISTKNPKIPTLERWKQLEPVLGPAPDWMISLVWPAHSHGPKKPCPDCGETDPNAFYSRAATPKCRKCWNRYYRFYRRKHYSKRVQRTQARITYDMRRQAKTCNECAEVKSFSEFAINKRATDGRAFKCKECRRRLYPSNSTTHVGDRDAIKAMQKKQCGKCAICDQFPTGMGLVLDHDHNTGHRRGLLCMACNVGLGNFQDDLQSLRAAAAYLETTIEIEKRPAAVQATGRRSPGRG